MPTVDCPKRFTDMTRLIAPPSVGRESELEAIVNTWGPDSIEWYGLPNAGTAIHDESDYVRSGGDPKRVVLEAWWD